MSIFVVVEPHADDAYLSMHQHMVDWIKAGDKVVVLTVFSGTRKRAKDGAAYAEAIGAQWEGLGFVEGSETDPFAGKVFDPKPGLLGMLHPDDAVIVVAPIGIQHPEHKAVNAWIRDGLYGSQHCLLFYADIPYYSKLKNQEDANNMLLGKKINSIKKPKHYKADEKYWKCFKDQAKFFHFNPPETFKDIVEIVVDEYY